MTSRFTAFHRGGSGPPLVCLHGFMDTWRTWELVLPMLERRHDVLAPTLPGHAGGEAITGDMGIGVFVDAVERCMDAARVETAHLVGNSLGGYLALQLAARGRARSVVAFAPAGGWSQGDESVRDLFSRQRALHEQLRAALPAVDALQATEEGRRQATRLLTENFEHIPGELIAHLLVGAAACTSAVPLLGFASTSAWTLDAQQVQCPVRIVWGAGDRLLPWPQAAVRYRDGWLPHADWVVLDGVGHCPQLDVPVEAAHLILDFTDER